MTLFFGGLIYIIIIGSFVPYCKRRQGSPRDLIVWHRLMSDFEVDLLRYQDAVLESAFWPIILVDLLFKNHSVTK
jgi:hypothetical protein